MRCPVCGSRNVKKLKTGSYQCLDCGFIFYPERDAIIDLRDFVSADELSEEEKEIIGEKVKEAGEEMTKETYSEDIKHMFRKDVSLEDIATRYGEGEYLYGIFIDFEDSVSGTLLLIIPESEVSGIINKYKGGVVSSLKSMARDSFEAFIKKLSWDAKIKNIDIAYDTMNALMNYLSSEVDRDKNILMLNYQLISDEKPKGELLFLPSKNTLRLLRGFM